MILNDELEARNDNEIVMREIDPMKTEDVQSKYIAGMLIAADRHGSKDLKNLALDKIRADREIFNDEGFRRKMQEA